MLLNTGDGLKTLDAVGRPRRPDRHAPPVLDAFTAYAIEKAGLLMSVTVRIPTILRTHTGGAAEVSVEGATLGEVLAALDAAPSGHRGPRPRRRRRLRRFVNVYVGDEDVRFAEGPPQPPRRGPPSR